MIGDIIAAWLIIEFVIPWTVTALLYVAWGIVYLTTRTAN
jgi:hypothetical protein